MSISRSTARSAELMSATVTEPSWMSGLISVSAPPRTRATCDFLYFSASLMASARLSSSRNCENSGANLRVSSCALRRSHHFLIVIESDQIDMIARTHTMPLAKPAIWLPEVEQGEMHTVLLSGGWVSERCVLTVMLNLNGCCTSCFTFLPPTSAGKNRMRGQRGSNCLREQVVGGLEHLERADVGLARRVDDELGLHFALDARLTQHVRIARLRGARELARPASRPGTRSTV